jgi:hypothetical protein
MFEFCPGERRSPSENIVEEHASFPAFPLANITYGVAMNYLELQTQLKFKCEVE